MVWGRECDRHLEKWNDVWPDGRFNSLAKNKHIICILFGRNINDGTIQDSLSSRFDQSLFRDFRSRVRASITRVRGWGVCGSDRGCMCESSGNKIKREDSNITSSLSSKHETVWGLWCTRIVIMVSIKPENVSVICL